jgi:hypothetical protein
VKTFVHTSKQTILLKKLIILSLFISSFVNIPVKATPIITYRTPEKLLEIGPFASYYVDETNMLSYQDIRNLPPWKFKTGKSKMINLGFSQFPVWLKFNIKNLTGEQLYVYLEAQEIDYVDVLVVSKDSVYHIETGALRAYGKRQFHINSIVIPLGANPESLFISIKDINRLVFPLKIGAVGPLVEKVYNESIINAFVTGVLLVIVVLSFFFYLNFKDLTYLVYSIHIAFSILTMLIFEGYLFEMLWQDMPYLNNGVYSNLVRVSTLLSSMAFSVHFLDLRKIWPKLVQLYLAFAVLAFLTVPARVAGFEQAEKWFNLIVMIVFASYLIIGLVTYRQGFRPARFYLLGWSIYIFEVILLMLTSFDVITFDHFYTYYGYQTGTVFLAVFLGLALTDRIKALRGESKHSQQLALRYLTENKHILEEQNRLMENRLEQTGRTDNMELISLLKSIRAEKEQTPRISISTQNGIIFCTINDIVRIEAEGSYASLQLSNGEKILASRTLSTFENQLTGFPEFVKIHKSHLININFVARYHKGDGGHVLLKNGAELTVSRAAKAELLDKLGLSS